MKKKKLAKELKRRAKKGDKSRIVDIAVQAVQAGAAAGSKRAS